MLIEITESMCQQDVPGFAAIRSVTGAFRLLESYILHPGTDGDAIAKDCTTQYGFI